ncbi:kinase-like protein [Nitrosococcus halophilus Nc 4]|uniref:Kinase-like protein n=1 Tax=Nitrosococcus halophilus (strain Nc4) TaxID=472759 RepID=D5BXE6_NITHN|nr:kinase [Nitrosococcus halophilus]ADE15829.1 kinase-like protein [Nitrosococcus halophilus Nc 4]
MSEQMSMDYSISSILRLVGKGKRMGTLDARARHVLEQLEICTDRFWGVSESSYTQRLETKCQLLPLVYSAFEARCQQLQLAPPLELLWRVYLPLAQWVVAQGERISKEVFVLGVNGAQGSGKSTLCSLLQVILEAGFSQRVAILSIDDFYLSRAERQHLADQVHPLLITRGVPGTHDVPLAIEILKFLQGANQEASTPLPVFDKGLDDPLPREEWPTFQGKPDVILFEGWCVGAKPEPEQRLARPVNALEAEEDLKKVWRGYVNQVLGNQYSRLFGLLDGLLFLKIPEFKVVYTQRLEQEQQLAQALRQGWVGRAGRRAMSMPELRRFIMHFQRLTEYLLEEMPGRADLVLEIDEHRQFQGVTQKDSFPS